MQMCATSRVVVVLPLVPVTDTTGIRGVTTRGPSPGGAAATSAARRATASSRGWPREQVVEQQDRSRRPAPRPDRGAATRRHTRRRRARSRPGCGPPAGRSPPRPRARGSPARRCARAACWRCAEPGAPGWPRRRPSVARHRPHRVRGRGEVAGEGQGHLDRGAREVEVRTLEEAHLAGVDRRGGVVVGAGHAGSLVRRRVGGRRLRRPSRGSRRRRAPSRRWSPGTSPRAARRRRVPRVRRR